MNSKKGKHLEDGEAVPLPGSVRDVEELPENEFKLTHVALGTYQNHRTGEWMVARVVFSPVTGEAKLDKSIGTSGLTRDYAIEEFKILAVREGIVG